MARLEAIEKALYYPTNERSARQAAARLVEMIHIGHDAADAVQVIDPCAGEGQALAAFCDEFRARSGHAVEAHAIELDAERAAACAALIPDTRAGALEKHRVKGAEIVFCNPPYDGTPGAGRVEYDFMAAALRMLIPSGILVAILPEAHFVGGRPGMVFSLWLKCKGRRVFHAARFCEHEYKEHGQFVAFIAKGYQCGDNIDVEFTLDDCCNNAYAVYTEPGGGFSIKERDAEDRRRAADVPEMRAAIDAYTGAAAVGRGAWRPLQELRHEHAALIAAAGMLNGIKIGARVIKGGTGKITNETKRVRINTDGTPFTEVTQREQFAARLTVFDTATGEITQAASHQESYATLLQQCAREFCTRAAAAYPPQTGDYTPGEFAQIRAPRTPIAGHDDGLLYPQKRAAAAIVANWQARRGALLVGEMSTGKTAIAIAAAERQTRGKNQKIVVMIPAKKDLSEKWQGEAARMLQEYNIPAREVETAGELRAAMSLPGRAVLIIRETMMKACNSWARVDIEKLPKRRWREAQHHDGTPGALRAMPICPECGAAIDIEKYNKGEKPTCGARHCTKCGERETSTKAIHAGKCAGCEGTLKKCGAAYWYITGAGERQAARRFPLSKILARYYRRQYVLILDEAHGAKTGDSNRAYSAQHAIQGAARALLMTGTIYGGKASSVFYLLHYANADFRRDFAYNAPADFVNEYGLTQETYKETIGAGGHRVQGYRADQKKKTTECPGVHPALTSYILPLCVFIYLRDFEGIKMPKYTERTFFVDCPTALSDAVDRYLEPLHKAGGAEYRTTGASALLAAWNWARFGVYDRPDQAETTGPAAYEPPEGAAEEVFPKEEALVRLIARERGRGRKVLCFVDQLQRRDPTPRLEKILAAHGMKGATMRASVTNRVDFIRAAIADGADVIFTSPALVSEGVDIVETPSTVWYCHTWSAYTMPQANRRAYRLTQTQPVEIYYLAYNETHQARAMVTIAQKMKAQQVIQGDIANGIARALGGHDMVDDLQECCISDDDDAAADRRRYDCDLKLEDLPAVTIKTAADDVEVESIERVNIDVTAEQAESTPCNGVATGEDEAAQAERPTVDELRAGIAARAAQAQKRTAKKAPTTQVAAQQLDLFAA